MVAAARDLTDVVYVTRHHVEALVAFGRRVVELRVQHEKIEGGANDPTTGRHRLDHLVGQLTLPRHKGPAVVVGSHDPARELLQGLPESLVRQVGKIQHDAVFRQAAIEG